jgi:hypothetical protein
MRVQCLGRHSFETQPANLDGIHECRAPTTTTTWDYFAVYYAGSFKDD